MKVILYISHLNRIGGIETFVLNFCQRMSKHYDITFVFSEVTGEDLLLKIGEHVNCLKLKKQELECDVLILASAWKVNPEKQIKADKYIQMVHADYTAYLKDWNFKYQKGDKTTHHVAVGENTARKFELATPYKIDAVINNLLAEKVKIKPRKATKVLRLITCSRISKEKGFERMLLLEKKLKGFDFIWHVYGDTGTNYAKQVIPQFSKVEFKGVTDKVQEVIQDYDYLVQLSDTEGFPYSVYESLQVHVPVISTDYPSIHELLTDGENGYILDMKLSNFHPEKLKDRPKIKTFKEKSNEHNWIEIIG